jgi:hypothetical protein
MRFGDGLRAIIQLHLMEGSMSKYLDTLTRINRIRAELTRFEWRTENADGLVEDRDNVVSLCLAFETEVAAIITALGGNGEQFKRFAGLVDTSQEAFADEIDAEERDADRRADERHMPRGQRYSDHVYDAMKHAAE